jgi:hypothetical protein
MHHPNLFFFRKNLPVFLHKCNFYFNVKKYGTPLPHDNLIKYVEFPGTLILIKSPFHVLIVTEMNNYSRT